MVKDPETFSFKLPAFQSVHSDSRSISLSACRLVHHLVDIMILSEVLMPIGYLSRLSHAFIYEFAPICAGRGLIRLSDLGFFSHLVFEMVLKTEVKVDTLQTFKCSPHFVAFSLRFDLLSKRRRAYRFWAYVYTCEYMRVCCEDPMACFTTANLSNERSGRGGREEVGGRQQKSEWESEGAPGPNYNTNHIKSIIKAVKIY